MQSLSGFSLKANYRQCCIVQSLAHSLMQMIPESFGIEGKEGAMGKLTKTLRTTF